MDQLPSNLDARSVLELYSERRSGKQAELPEIQDLNVQNRESIPSKLQSTAKSAIKADQEYNIVTDGEAQTNYGWDKRTLLLSAEVLDPSAPLSVTIERGVSRREKDGPEAEFGNEKLLVYLYRMNITGDTPHDRLQSRKDGNTRENIVGGMMYNVDDNIFDLRDRQILPEFRRQGLGSMALKCSEDYIQQVANNKQEEQTAIVDAAQVDVICWLWNSGYKPRTKEDFDNLHKVLEGNSQLCIGENLYVFNQSVPENERTADDEDMDKALRIKFEKKFTPEAPEVLLVQQAKTAQQISKHVDIGR